MCVHHKEPVPSINLRRADDDRSGQTPSGFLTLVYQRTLMSNISGLREVMKVGVCCLALNGESAHSSRASHGGYHLWSSTGWFTV